MLLGGLVTILALVSCVVGLPWVPVCDGPGFQIIPKPNCRGWYSCVHGTPTEMPDCPPHLIFSIRASVCVDIGGPFDDCVPETIVDKCLTFTTSRFPHPTNCHQYYDCTVFYDPIPLLFEQHLVECTYPQLYKTETQQCEDFANVDCGTRIEAVDGCEYLVNQCPVAHCVPCSIRFPSCRGLSDGIHPHPEKEWSPFFIRCMSNRFVTEETCPLGTDGRRELFHRDQNQCVSQDLVPQENGGTMPDCTGLSDGGHMDNIGRCDRYFVCSTGQLVGTEICLPGEVYDSESRVCKLSSLACPPCGTSPLCSTETTTVTPP